MNRSRCIATAARDARTARAEGAEGAGGPEKSTETTPAEAWVEKLGEGLGSEKMQTTSRPTQPFFSIATASFIQTVYTA
jgi:hypothetical protein